MACAAAPGTTSPAGTASGRAPAPWEGTDGFLESECAYTRYFPSADGKQRLCLYFWPAKGAPKGVIQVTHGHGCYIPHNYLRVPNLGQPPVYEGSWIQSLNNDGWAVFGVDHRGAGRSTGLRSYCEHFDDYIEDGLLAARKYKGVDVPGFEKVESLPLFLMGHSLGGCLALMMAIRTKGEALYRGVLLLAPMLSLEKVAAKGVNRYLRPLAALANVLIPSWPIVQVDKNAKYPDIQDQFDNDPLNKIGNTRVRNANEYLRVTAWLMANMHKEVTFPFLVFHSENDTMCDVDGSKALYERAPSADKQLKLVNHMWHIVVKEPKNETVLEDVIKWINERMG